jgi:hypothetical protein
VAAVGLPGDIGEAMFRQSFIAKVDGALRRLPLAYPVQVRTFQREITQHSLSCWSVMFSGQGNALRIDRLGSVAAARTDRGNEGAVALIQRDTTVIEALWTEAAAVCRDLGATGTAHIAIRLGDPSLGGVDIDRWATVFGPTAADVASVQREAARAIGVFAVEPES